MSICATPRASSDRSRAATAGARGRAARDAPSPSGRSGAGRDDRRLRPHPSLPTRGRGIERLAPCSPSPIPNASPRTAAADRARSCSSTAAAPISTPPPRWRASRSSLSPSLPGRRRRAASCSPRRSRLPRSRRAFPIASRRARRSCSMPRAQACVGEGAGGSALSRCPTSRCRSSPTTTPRKSSPPASPVSVSTGCRGPNRCSNGATGSCFCAQAKARNGLTCPTRRLRKPQTPGSHRRSRPRPRSARSRPMN